MMAKQRKVRCPACGQEFNLGGWGQHGKTLKKVGGKWVCSRSGVVSRKEEIKGVGGK